MAAQERGLPVTTIDADGADLFVKEAGRGPPVLLIHGIAIDADSWRTVFDDLALEHRVIAYDRRRFSRSRADPVSDWTRHAEDAATILRELDAFPATVVGWSAGGLIAIELALLHPESVASIVLIEPALYVRKSLTPAVAWHFARAKALHRLGMDRQAIDGYYRFTTRYRGRESSWDRPEYPDERREVVRQNAAAIFTEMESRDDHLPPERLRQIQVPVTILLGEASPSWFKRMGDKVARALPQAEVRRIAGMNHAASFTAPDEVVSAIRPATPSPRDRRVP
jgi:pimeloyl-ACP methyl ester carboxylesterase